MNLFEGRLSDVGAGALTVDCAELGLGLVVAEGSAAPGAAVAVAVRPERIELSEAPSAALPNRLPGTIREVSYRGEASSVTVVLANGRLLRVTLPNSGRAGAPRVVPGTAVWLGWTAEASVLLTS